MRLALWLYRLGLKTLPSTLTQKHEQAMLELFEAELARACAAGRASWMAVFVTGTWDALARGLYERFHRAEARRVAGPVTPPASASPSRRSRSPDPRT